MDRTRRQRLASIHTNQCWNYGSKRPAVMPASKSPTQKTRPTPSIGELCSNPSWLPHIRSKLATGFARSTLGFGNGAFEESGEDIPAVAEEFYLESGNEAGAEDVAPTSGLKAKLGRRVAARQEAGQ